MKERTGLNLSTSDWSVVGVGVTVDFVELV